MQDIKTVLKYFLVWRLLLFLVIVLGLTIVPLQLNFLGGGLEKYLSQPYFWGFINFDGEHYLSIAYKGYRDLTYFFFPLYPILVKNILNVFNRTDFISLAKGGLWINTMFLLLAGWGMLKLFFKDYDKDISRKALIVFFLFPTSFYFVAYYTESLFLALVVWAFYFLKRKKWLVAGILGGLLTATRLVGLAFWSAYVVEILIAAKRGKKLNKGMLLGCLLVPLGLVLYMIYLQRVANDPLAFFHNVGIYGQQRSQTMILIPQVFYRYVFKIIPNINYSYFPAAFSIWLEFISALLFGGLLLLSISALVVKKLSIFKIKLSMLIYFLAGYLIPPLSGSFSSFSRYVLVLFPGFLLLSILLSKLNKVIVYLIYAMLIVFQIISILLFIRGYWLA